VSNVYHNQKTIKPQSAQGANSQVDQLRSALEAKLKSSTEAGLVQDIQVIKTALKKLDESSRNLSQTQTQAVAGSQVHAAQARQVINPVSGVISEKEALAIKSIRGVTSAVLPAGKQFASMEGREPSNASYMKANIKGLFDLVATKNV
jgi:ElaB/YqjD/DUF883 family membrane-anchored ribosome-binding protein